MLYVDEEGYGDDEISAPYTQMSSNASASANTENTDNHLIENIKTGAILTGTLTATVPAIVGAGMFRAGQKIFCPGSSEEVSCAPLGAALCGSIPFGAGAVVGGIMGAMCTPVTRFFGAPKPLHELRETIINKIDSLSPAVQRMG